MQKFMWFEKSETLTLTNQCCHEDNCQARHQNWQKATTGIQWQRTNFKRKWGQHKAVAGENTRHLKNSQRLVQNAWSRSNQIDRDQNSMQMNYVCLSGGATRMMASPRTNNIGIWRFVCLWTSSKLSSSNSTVVTVSSTCDKIMFKCWSNACKRPRTWNF